MNRRTFLKSVGAAVALISTPAMAKVEPKWINFTEAMPKVGQKVALLTRFANNQRQNISLGEVLERSLIHEYFNYPKDVAYIEICLSYSPNRPSVYGGNDLIVHGSFPNLWEWDLEENVQKAAWIVKKKIGGILRLKFWLINTLA